MTKDSILNLFPGKGDTPQTGLRILALDDFDLTAEAIDLMDQGRPESIPWTNEQALETRVLTKAPGHHVRLALIDLRAPSVDSVLNKAAKDEVDVVIAGVAGETPESEPTYPGLYKLAAQGAAVFIVTKPSEGPRPQ